MARRTLYRDAPGGHFPDCDVTESGEVMLCHCPITPVDPSLRVRRPAPIRVPVDTLPPPVEVVRELPGPGVLVAAMRCILLTALVGLLAFACGALTGCINAPTPDPSAPPTLGKLVYDATEAAWHDHAANLRAVRDEWDDCANLPLFRVRVMATHNDFLMACRRDANACLLWSRLPGILADAYPVAIVHPRVREDRHAAIGAHEMVHAFRACTYGNYDYAHADPRTWRPAPDSVEAVALRALYEPAE